MAKILILFSDFNSLKTPLQLTDKQVENEEFLIKKCEDYIYILIDESGDYDTKTMIEMVSVTLDKTNEVFIGLHNNSRNLHEQQLEIASNIGHIVKILRYSHLSGFDPVYDQFLKSWNDDNLSFNENLNLMFDDYERFMESIGINDTIKEYLLSVSILAQGYLACYSKANSVMESDNSIISNALKKMGWFDLDFKNTDFKEDMVDKFKVVKKVSWWREPFVDFENDKKIITCYFKNLNFPYFIKLFEHISCNTELEPELVANVYNEIVQNHTN